MGEDQQLQAEFQGEVSGSWVSPQCLPQPHYSLTYLITHQRAAVSTSQKPLTSVSDPLLDGLLVQVWQSWSIAARKQCPGKPDSPAPMNGCSTREELPSYVEAPNKCSAKKYTSRKSHFHVALQGLVNTYSNWAHINTSVWKSHR